MTRPVATRLVVVVAAAVVVVGALSLSRSGYSPDEEFTLFAVRGISADGLPVLPSGLLYDRGLLYSYLSWLGSALTGVELPAFRALSLMSAGGVILVGYALVRALASPAAGIAAAMLVAASLPFWVVATTGRFYAPFVLASVAVLAATQRWPAAPVRTGPHLSAPAAPVFTLAVLAFVARLLHELAFTLLAVPVAGLVLSRIEGRWRQAWVPIAVVIGAGLVAAQGVLTGLHFVLPQSGGSTMIERFFVWQVLNLFERPRGGPLGLVCAAIVVGWLLVPARAGAVLRLGLCGIAALLGITVGYLGATATWSFQALTSTIQSGLTYPLDMFWHLVASEPVMVGVAMALLVARLLGAGGEWPAGERAAHLGWVAWVLWFGVIESGITVNYVLLPTVCMLAAIGIDLVALAKHGRGVLRRRPLTVVQVLLDAAALLVVADQWSGSGSPARRLAEARPTLEIVGIDDLRGMLQPQDRIACTDELACLYLVNRVDAWLALDDYVRDRFVVRRDGQDVGVYAGAPAVFRPGDLFAPGASGRAPARVLVIDVFKEYPVGRSSAWLPRALEEDGLQGRVMVETGRLRVIEVVGRRD